MFKGSIRNSHLDLIVKRHFIPAGDFVQSQVTGASTVLNAAFGAGSNELLEMGTSSLGAIRFVDTTGDINTLWVPTDFDNRFPLYVRYLWGTSRAAADGGSVTFVTLYTALPVATAIATGATALTKAHGVSQRQFNNVDSIQWSNYGYIAPLATGTFANNTVPQATIAISFNMKISAVGTIVLATDFVHVLGMELSYTPRLTFGQSTRAARLLADGLRPSQDLDVTKDI